MPAKKQKPLTEKERDRFYNETRQGAKLSKKQYAELENYAKGAEKQSTRAHALSAGKSDKEMKDNWSVQLGTAWATQARKVRLQEHNIDSLSHAAQKRQDKKQLEVKPDNTRTLKGKRK